MEIVLKQGDRLPIPDGCEAVVDDRVIIIEQKGNELKDGDIVVIVEKSNNFRCPFIFKGKDDEGYNMFYVGLDVFMQICESTTNSRFGNADPILATAEEKQLLFDKMREKGLQWNAKEKRIEKERWRAPIGEQYFYLLDNFVVDSHFEANDKIDCGLYDLGNYFRTKEQAEKAVGVIKEALRRFFTEN